ncbi:MAG: hypothetical protein JW719_01505 [Pirellulales bacterium]|nr:hypothetical protein [Pirellulales bacterium]
MGMFFGRIASFAMILLLGSMAAAHGPSCVNEYGDPERLVFEGCKTFTAEEVAETTAIDPEVILAGHPAAPLEDYLATLSNKILSGYKRVGFPYAQVTSKINHETKKIHIAIEEGPRYMAGEILVRGNQNVVATELVKTLTSPGPPDDARRWVIEGADGKTTFKWVDREGADAEMEDPVWEPGKPAPFDWIAHENIERWTRRALADQGFFSTFEISLLPQSDGKTAHLLIRISDEGSRAVLGDIVITGNKNNTREEILDYLGLKPGMSVPPNWAAELEYRLWRSGRFIRSDVTLDAPTTNNQATLQINLLESPWAPRLSEPLAEEQKILLKLRDQLVNPKLWPGDLTASVDASDQSGRLVISPAHGFFVSLHYDPNEDKGLPRGLDVSVVFSDQEYGFFCPTLLAAKFLKTATSPPQSKFYSNLAFRLDENLDDREKNIFIKFDLCINGLDKDESPHVFQPQLNADPSFIVALSRINDAKCVIEDGVLTVSSSTDSYRVDASTGRLLEMTGIMQDKSGQSRYRIQFEANAYQAQLDEIKKATAHCPNRFDPKTPWTSWISVLCSEELLGTMKEYGPETLRWLRLIRVMQQKGVLDGPGGLSEIVGQLFPQKDTSDKDSFTIPCDPAVFGNLNESNLQSFLLTFGVRFTDKVFSRRSWPWTLLRELLLVAAQRSKYTGAELQELWQSESTGPIFCLLAACALEHLDQPTAVLFATQGLNKMSAADFRKDCRALLLQDGIAGQCAQRMAQAIRELTPEEIEQIIGVRAADEPSMLADLIRTLQSKPEQPWDDALLDALTAAWEASQRNAVKTELMSICERNRQESQKTTR